MLRVLRSYINGDATTLLVVVTSMEWNQGPTRESPFTWLSPTQPQPFQPLRASPSAEREVWADQ